MFENMIIDSELSILSVETGANTAVEYSMSWDTGTSMFIGLQYRDGKDGVYLVEKHRSF